MADFWQRLLTADYMPHGYCLLWFQELLWLHVIADLLIVFAYYTIPAALLYLVLKRREVPFRWMFFMFSAFIFACGTTHLFGIWTLWNGDYGVQGLVKLATGGLSVATAILLIPLLPRALALRSPAELERRVAERTAELLESNRCLHEQMAERERAEVALRLSEERFRVMAEAVPDMLFISHADGACEYFNQRFYAYTGLTPDSALDHGWRTAVHPADLDGQNSQRRELTAAGQPFAGEYRFRDRSGTYRWFVVRAYPIQDSSGGQLRWFGTCTDIDDLKRAETVLRQQAEQLAEADRRKDDFLAMLAHELRNPLAAVRNAVDLFKLDALASANQQQRARAIIDRQITHLSRLVDDLLDVARIARNKIVLDQQPLLLSDSVAAAVETVRATLNARHHTLSVSVTLPPLTVYADPARLTQIVANLLDNAAKYTEDSGQIELSVSQHGAEAVISVRDNGIGIPPEQLATIFDTFIQLDRSLARARGGLGLGLTLVRDLVALHGGRVTAASAGPGQGSEFCIYLPLAAPGNDIPAQPAAARPVAAQRVLVVDDNADAADALTCLLSTQGHETRAAYDGQTALLLAQTFQPTAAVLDIGLPDMDGYELARRLRSLYGESLRLVALSGYGQAQDVERARQAGFDQHLLKPASFAAVQAALAA